MEEIFFNFPDFFCYFFHNLPGKQTEPDQPDADVRQSRRQPEAGTAERQQIDQPAQHHAQQHEQAQASASGDASQQEQRQGREQRKQQGSGGPGPAPAAPPGQRHQKIVDEAQRRSAAEADERLNALRTGVDSHQPISLPNRPRLLLPLSAYSSMSILPSTSSSPPSRFSRFSRSPLPRIVS